MTYEGRRDVHVTAEVEAAAGVTYRQLRRWVLLGLLPQPEKHSRGHGRGVVALWSTEALQLARRIGELRRQGYTMPAVKRKLAEPSRPNGRRRR